MALSDFDLIALLPRAPEKRSTPELLSRLAAAGHQLTPRSLQRRLASLSLTQPIVCDDRSKPFGWSIASTAPTNLGIMSTQEALALKLAQRYLGEALPAEVLDDLKQYFHQADAKLKDESLYRAWLGKVRLLPASQPLLKPTTARNVLAGAYVGVLRGTVLNVTYRPRGADKAKTYDIEPLAIIVRGSVTYLAAVFPWAQDATLMALHRFSSVKQTEQKIRPPLNFDLDQFIKSGALGFGVASLQAVHVRFYNGAGAHLEETPVHADQILKIRDDGDIDLLVTVPVTEQFKWWLLGFGDRVEVLAPTALRKELRARLTVAVKRYNREPQA
jgi:predicted DNA-binding transcriptional regulator YafY